MCMAVEVHHRYDVYGFSIFSPIAPEPESHDHAPTSPLLNEGSLVAKK